MVKVWLKTLAYLVLIVIPGTLATFGIPFLMFNRWFIGVNVLVVATILVVVWLIAAWQGYWRFYATAALPAYVVAFGLTPAKLAALFAEPETNFTITRFHTVAYRSSTPKDAASLVRRLRKHYGSIAITRKN